MEKGYKYLEDEATADIAFEAYGKDLNELFENCCSAVTEIMVDLDDVNPLARKEFTKESDKVEDLLFDLLSEIVSLKDSDSLLFRRFVIRINEEDGKYKMEAALYGQLIEEIPNLKLDVKAITLHKFWVKKENDKWKAHMIVDV